MRAYLNWKSFLLLLAIIFVIATLFYTNQLASDLAKEEKKRVELLISAIKTSNTSTCPDETGFALGVMTNNENIPLIITNESGQVISHINIDTNGKRDVNKFLASKKELFIKDQHQLIVDYGLGKNYVYYGESFLLQQLRYFPYVQLAIMILLVTISIIALRSAQKSMQNQVWVGLSKETAHQLGTPLSSLEGWLELLDEHPVNKEAVADMKKDMDRLKLVADRFAKIGNTPELVEADLKIRLTDMVAYMQKRAPKKVNILLESPDEEILVNLNGPLFDWVIENLIRNALDAVEGEGTIILQIKNTIREVMIDVSDNGKGISGGDWQKVFHPGYSTKKRGWGLGLSLAKRIVEQYHLGSIFVKYSEPGVGTRFRIILRR